MSNHQNNSQLSEQYIQDSFHSYLKSSLTQAKAERLLDADILSSAEGDLMITGECSTTLTMVHTPGIPGQTCPHVIIWSKFKDKISNRFLNQTNIFNISWISYFQIRGL